MFNSSSTKRPPSLGAREKGKRRGEKKDDKNYWRIFCEMEKKAGKRGSPAAKRATPIRADHTVKGEGKREAKRTNPKSVLGRKGWGKGRVKLAVHTTPQMEQSGKGSKEGKKEKPEIFRTHRY